MKQGLKTLFRETSRIASECIRHMRDADTRILAGSLAFSTIISLIPLLAVSLSVFHAYGGFEPLLAKIEPFLLQNLVSDAGADITQTLHKAIRRIHSRALGMGAAIALFLTSAKLFLDIELGVQRIWGLRSTRPWWLRLGIYSCILFLGPLILAVLLGAMSSSDVGLLTVLPKGSISFLFVLVGLSAIHYWVPARNVSARAAVWSALFSALAVVAAQEVYFFITKKILAYNKIYGSLASVPIFLLWILVLWWISLVGMALCRSLHERLKPEST